MNNKIVMPRFNSFIFILLLFNLACNKREDYKYYIEQNGNIIVEKYKKGKIVERISYQSDTATKEGKATYYNNDSVIRTEHWNSGKLAGSFTMYSHGFPAGFICFDSYGDTIFSRNFSGNSILNEDGKILPHGVFETDNLYTDSTVRYVSFIVNPPYVGITVKSYIINLNNNDTIKPNRLTEMYDWVHYSTFKITESGNYKFKQTVFLTDSLKDMLTLRIVDTAFFSRK